MWLDIFQINHHVGAKILKLLMLPHPPLLKKRQLSCITLKGTVTLVIFSRIFWLVRDKDMYLRSHNITVCVRNAYSICVDKMIWKKGDSDYFELSGWLYEEIIWIRSKLRASSFLVDLLIAFYTLDIVLSIV